MSETLRNLRDNLQRQALLYAELNRLANLKQAALVQNNLKDLESITVQEERLLLDAGHLEKERMLWAEQIGREMGKAPEELTLAELAEYYPELGEVRQDLENIVGSLRETHELNTQLLNQAMKIVNFTMNLLTGPAGTTYGPPANKDIPTPSRSRLVDRNI